VPGGASSRQACRTPRGHRHGPAHHAQGGRERMRGVVFPRGRPSAVAGGGTAGRPQRPRRATAGGWCRCGVGASGCPRAVGPGGGRVSPRLVGGLRVVHPGRERRVAVRLRAPLGGPARGAGVPEAGRRPQRAPPTLCTSRAAPLAARRARRLGCAVAHGRRSGGSPDRRGRGDVRGPARPVAWASCLGVRPTAPVTPGAWHHLSLLPGCGAHRAQTPRRCASADQADGGPSRGEHVVPLRPLTTHWSRPPTASAPLRSACASGGGSPRAFGFSYLFLPLRNTTQCVIA
jgi:hypothetical protein